MQKNKKQNIFLKQRERERHRKVNNFNLCTYKYFFGESSTTTTSFTLT